MNHEEIMLAMGRQNGLNDQFLSICMALKQIDHLIKGFVQDVCDDMGVNSKDLFYKTEIVNGTYILALFRGEDKHMAKYGWTLDEFLTICSNKDKVQMEFNTVIRKLILNLDVNTDNSIWVPSN